MSSPPWAVLEIAGDILTLATAVPGETAVSIVARAPIPAADGGQVGPVIDPDGVWLTMVQWLALLPPETAGIVLISNAERRIALDEAGVPLGPVPLHGLAPPDPAAVQARSLAKWLAGRLGGDRLAESIADPAGLPPLPLATPVDRAGAVLARHRDELTDQGSLVAMLDRTTVFGPQRSAGRSRATGPLRRIVHWIAGPRADDVLATAADVGILVEGGCLALPHLDHAEAPYPGADKAVIQGPQPANQQQRVALATLTTALIAAGTLEAVWAGSPVLLDGPGSRNSLFCQLLAALRPDLSIFLARGEEAAILGAVATASGTALPPARLRRVPVRPIGGLDDYAQAWSRAMQAGAP